MMRFSRTVSVYTLSLRAGERLVRRVSRERAAMMCLAGEAVIHTQSKKLISSIRVVRTTEQLKRVGEPTGLRSSTTRRILVEVKAGPCCRNSQCPMCRGTNSLLALIPVSSRELKRVFPSDKWAYHLALTDCGAQLVSR